MRLEELALPHSAAGFISSVCVSASGNARGSMNLSDWFYVLIPTKCAHLNLRPYLPTHRSRPSIAFLESDFCPQSISAMLCSFTLFCFLLSCCPKATAYASSFSSFVVAKGTSGEGAVSCEGTGDCKWALKGVRCRWKSNFGIRR